ncbi:hypothetical protein F2Q70_00005636 [Brassica cretica]|uniref:Uncharacterized protein n=1 Tax=Brassica cretica TaxID=69181 RepID=A0A8S9IWL5_BRACR|nr:hypothetical protein F2Q70_00005636 [Brassica cretica]
MTEKSVTSAAVNGWTRVASKSSPPKSLAIPGKSKAVDIPVKTSQFDSEEVMISEAHQVTRNRLAAAEADFPPFSYKKDRKYYRKKQRQAIMKER